MPGHEVGVDPHDAHGKGADAEDYAAGFKALVTDFERVLGEDAYSAAGDTPKFSGLKTFVDQQSAAMEKVEEHGESLGRNVQSGAQEADSTDSESADGMAGASNGLSRRINIY